MSNNKKWTQYRLDNKSLSLTSSPSPFEINYSFIDHSKKKKKKIKKEPKQTTLNTLSPSSSSRSNSNHQHQYQTMQSPNLDNVLISMLTYRDGSWNVTTHMWEYRPSELKEVIHCCIDEMGMQNNALVKIGFDLWNYHDVDIIAFFNIDGQDMRRSLCPIVRANGQTFRATAFFERTNWHSICIKQSDFAEDPDDIDLEKLNAVGKIEVKVFKFALETVMSGSIISIDQTDTKLEGVKCKVNSDKGAISVTKGEKIENANVTVGGHPDFSQLLKSFDIYYHTPDKYRKLTSNNKNLNEARIMPTPGGNNMLGLAVSNTTQSTPCTPTSVSQTGSSSSPAPQPISELPNISPHITTNTVPPPNSIPPITETPVINPSPSTPSNTQTIINPPTVENQPILKRKEIEVISLDSDDEDDNDNSEQSGVAEPERKKSKPSDNQEEANKNHTSESLFKLLKKELSMEEVSSMYSLEQVKNMNCDQLTEFISNVLGDRQYQFNLDMFEMNEIDGNVYVTKFAELVEMGLEKGLIQEMEKILKILK